MPLKDLQWLIQLILVATCVLIVWSALFVAVGLICVRVWRNAVYPPSWGRVTHPGVTAQPPVSAHLDREGQDLDLAGEYAHAGEFMGEEDIPGPSAPEYGEPGTVPADDEVPER